MKWLYRYIHSLLIRNGQGFVSSFVTLKTISSFLASWCSNWSKKIFRKTKFYPYLVGSDETPRRRKKFLTLDQKIEIVECHEAGMRHAAIARERGMNESTVRSILKRKDHIKKLVDRTPHWSPTMVRKICHFMEIE